MKVKLGCLLESQDNLEQEARNTVLNTQGRGRQLDTGETKKGGEAGQEKGIKIQTKLNNKKVTIKNLNRQTLNTAGLLTASGLNFRSHTLYMLPLENIYGIALSPIDKIKTILFTRLGLGSAVPMHKKRLQAYAP